MSRSTSESAGSVEFRADRLHRRQLLCLGGLSGTGLLLSDLFRARAAAPLQASGNFGRAKSVIMLYLHGGHAQQETWDPKPNTVR